MEIDLETIITAGGSLLAGGLLTAWIHSWAKRREDALAALHKSEILKIVEESRFAAEVRDLRRDLAHVRKCAREKGFDL